ncbi:MAG: hypothetical protein ACTSUQ_07945 [Candidatus Freyarchaeota archaeon]
MDSSVGAVVLNPEYANVAENTHLVRIVNWLHEARVWKFLKHGPVDVNEVPGRERYGVPRLRRV